MSHIVEWYYASLAERIVNEIMNSYSIQDLDSEDEIKVTISTWSAYYRDGEPEWYYFDWGVLQEMLDNTQTFMMPFIIEEAEHFPDSQTARIVLTRY